MTLRIFSSDRFPVLHAPSQAPSPLRKAVLQTLAAASVVAALAPSADASPTGRSIAIKFGTDQPGRATLPTTGSDLESVVNAAAGVLNTLNWNNFAGGTQAAPQTLSVDLNSGSIASTATVVWSSAGTWSSTGHAGEENNTAQNTATNESGDLMGGYLDTQGLGGTGISVNVTGLNAAGFTLGYDVFVYIQGGVNGRGGTYTLGAFTDTHTTLGAFNGTFVEDTDVAGTTANSNYLVFRNVVGNAFTLTSAGTIGTPERAPINGIEIRSVPEPATLSALAGGVAILLAWRRRRQA